MFVLIFLVWFMILKLALCVVFLSLFLRMFVIVCLMFVVLLIWMILFIMKMSIGEFMFDRVVDFDGLFAFFKCHIRWRVDRFVYDDVFWGLDWNFFEWFVEKRCVEEWV